MTTRYYKNSGKTKFFAINENGIISVDTEDIPSIISNPFRRDLSDLHYKGLITINKQEFLRAYNRTLERIDLAAFGNEKPKKSTCNLKVILKNIKSFITKPFN